MLGKFITAHKENPQWIDLPGVVRLLMSMLDGPGDTTATTMSALLFFLLKDTVCLETELHRARLSRDVVPAYSQTASLSYLPAAVMESMRMSLIVTRPLKREVPVDGVTLAGCFIPEGTPVGIFVPALHRNRSVLREDADLHRPERWLGGDVASLRKMEQASMEFSRGRRVCLGQHVADTQMKKVIPALVLRFDFAFVDTNAWLDADISPMVPVLKPLWIATKERE